MILHVSFSSMFLKLSFLCFFLLKFRNTFPSLLHEFVVRQNLGHGLLLREEINNGNNRPKTWHGFNSITRSTRPRPPAAASASCEPRRARPPRAASSRRAAHLAKKRNEDKKENKRKRGVFFYKKRHGKNVWTENERIHKRIQCKACFEHDTCCCELRITASIGLHSATVCPNLHRNCPLSPDSQWSLPQKTHNSSTCSICFSRSCPSV